MSRRRARGYSLLEVIVSLAVFGTFMAIFFVLTAEMRAWEKRLPVNFLRHPQIIAVVSRLRRDVLDAHIPSGPYLDEFGAFTASSKVLIIDTLMPDGSIQTVVWDFREAGVVKRRAYLKTLLKQLWTARGVPTDFSHTVAIDAVEFDDRPYGVRILALDDRGRIAIDQILQPRAY